MTEYFKLSLWDAFAFFLSGWTVCASIFIHAYLLGLPINAELVKLPTAVLGFAAFLVPLLVGLLFDPIGNKIGDIACKIGSWIRSIAFKIWFSALFLAKKFGSCINSQAVKKKCLKSYVKSTVPSMLYNEIEPYHWAKDYLIQEKIETPYMSFLSKFGFYRNIGALLFINAVLIPCLYGFGMNEKVFFLSFLAAAILYLFRSQRFYHHMGDCIYRNYAILHDRRGEFRSEVRGFYFS